MLISCHPSSMFVCIYTHYPSACRRLFVSFYSRDKMRFSKFWVLSTRPQLEIDGLRTQRSEKGLPQSPASRRALYISFQRTCDIHGECACTKQGTALVHHTDLHHADAAAAVELSGNGTHPAGKGRFNEAQSGV